MGPFAGVAACAPLAGLALGEAPLGPPSVPVHEDNPQAHVKLTLGDKLLLSGDLGRNQVSWAPCHPNAANTHPGTFPKFPQQLGKGIPLFEEVNGCLRNPLDGDPLPADDREITALQAYIQWERRGDSRAGQTLSQRVAKTVVAGRLPSLGPQR